MREYSTIDLLMMGWTLGMITSLICYEIAKLKQRRKNEKA